MLGSALVTPLFSEGVHPYPVCVLLLFAPRSAASWCNRNWLGGAGLHRDDLCPRWLNCPRTHEDGWDGPREGVLAAHPTPSSPAPRLSRITQGVKLSDCLTGREIHVYRVGVSVSLSLLASGQDLGLVSGLLAGCATSCVPTANPAMTYWPRIGASRLLVVPAVLLPCCRQARRLLGAWATSELFPAASDEIFFFLPLAAPGVHHLFSFSPKTSHSQSCPPRPRRFDFPPQAATPNGFVCIVVLQPLELSFSAA